MAVIVPEFDAACKIETGEEHAFAARQARGRSQAEAARHDAIDGAVRAQRFHALLGELVDGALVVALGGEHALFAFEQDA